MRPRVLSSLLALCLGSLPACGGASDDPAGMSQATVTLTDSATEELELFEVDVTGIVLHRLSGSTVSVLPRTTTVDFASLEDLAELVVGVRLEIGSFTGVTMTLDFTSARVFLKGQSAAAAILNGAGTPLTGTLAVHVDFAQADHVTLLSGRNHLFVLDLDLDQAITVDQPNNRVTFVPTASVTVDPTNPKPIAATGFLESVDSAEHTFVLEKRTPSGDAIGTFTVRTTTSTVYQLGGVVSLGNSGFAAFAAMALDTTRVFVQGTLDSGERVLDAVAVEAGAGTFGSGQDWVEGVVVGRNNGAGSDASLTVRGRSRVAATGVWSFDQLLTVDVQLGPTKVLRRGAGNVLNANALNVGQRIVAFGTLSGTTLDATAPTGVVRMLPTSVVGTAAGVPAANTLTLDVARIDRRPISDFNFMVGGTMEATPTAYTVDVTGIVTTGIVLGSRVRVIGWANPVGVLGDRDFRAASVVNRTSDARLLVCRWVPPAPGAITVFSILYLVLDVSSATTKAVEDGVSSLALQNTPLPKLVPRFAAGIYRIVQNNTVEVHFGFPAFETALGDRVNGSIGVASVMALGSFEPSTQQFDASVITAVLR